MYNIYFYLIISIFIISFVWTQILSWLNRKMMSPVLPEELIGIYPPEKYAKQQEYQLVNSRFGLISGGVSFAIMLIILLFGLLGCFDNFLREYTSHFLALPLIFFAILIITNEIISFPFNWYETFTIEERFGFNKSTRKLFIADCIKGILLNLVI